MQVPTAPPARPRHPDVPRRRDPLTDRTGRANNAVRVLVVDTRAVFACRGALVRSVDEFELVGEAETGEQAVELAAVLRPELVLMTCGCPEFTVQKRLDAFSKNFPIRGSSWCRRTRPTTCQPRSTAAERAH